MKLEMFRRLFSDRHDGASRGRRMTKDAAFTFRMGAGFAGDVNRTHPASIEPCLIDAANPPLFYGEAVIADLTSTNGVRAPVAGDSGLASVFGVTVRPFPIQAGSGSNFGAVALGVPGVPPASGVIDILKSGYIMVNLAGAAAALKGSPVFVWVAASSGSHVQGGFEAAATGGSTVALDATGDRYYFNGPADSNGIVELAFNL